MNASYFNFSNDLMESRHNLFKTNSINNSYGNFGNFGNLGNSIEPMFSSIKDNKTFKLKPTTSFD